MARKITVALEDDLNGGPADETVRFGIAGAEYEIDLSNKNATAFRRSSHPSSNMPARPAGNSAAGRAYHVKPGAQRRYPGVGERPRHRGQRPRAHPGERR